MVSGAKPVIGHLTEFHRSPEELFRRGRAEHGDMFTFALPGGHKAVALLGPERSRLFFAETDRALSVRPAYPFIARMFAPDFFFVAPFDEYRRQRQIILPRFQGRQLDGYVTAMDAEAVALIEQLGDAGEFTVTDHFAPLAARIAARCFLGRDLAAAIDQDFFAEFRRFSGGIASFPRGDWPLPKFIRGKRARNRLRVILGDLIAERRKAPLDPPDFLQTIAEAHYPDGSPVPDLVLINLILLLIVGGHETTAGHMSWALLDLLGNPRELASATSESAEVLAGNGFCDFASVKPLRHLDLCLLETERLHPVANLLVREALAPLEVDGTTIPAGTVMFVSPAVSHRLADLWPEPDAFRPERFAGEEGKLARQMLIGFGGGTHRCIGLHFAHLEMKIVLARLLTHFDMELVDGPPQPVRGFRAKWPASPCRVRYRARVTSPV
ncbi:cytochrome P450 [Lentzea tibetensis]|uniref:Cytochrome P450 n=2 Tax=Lentzea tibetensis TaxID=2591470 RepID=A0A563ESE8_9PSEU|nr:cytochrome P450 [Lentzea tibetensis]